MNDLYTQFDNVFFEKTRLSLITLIIREEKISFNDLKDYVGGTDGAVYTHLEKLIKGGYAQKGKEIIGTTVSTMYSLTDLGISEFKKYITFLENVLKNQQGDRK